MRYFPAKVSFLLLLFATVAHAQRVELNFNSGWKFAKGQQDRTVIEQGFDDFKWKDVRLPHDWAISGPFNPDMDGQSGKLPWQGEGWYRKTFKVESFDQGRCVYLDFDGVMAEPRIYVNGRPVGGPDYGCMAFRVDITHYVKFGENNVVAVHADTRRHEARGYPGAGIYRKVRLVICDPVHVARPGIHVTTPAVESDEAEARIRTSVENLSGKPVQVELESIICDPSGRKVGAVKSEAGVPAGVTNEFIQKIVIKDPQRWDVETPRLYTLRSSVHRDGKVCDETTLAFAIRTIEWTAVDGLHLNGRRVQLKGVTLHHDQGPLGTAFSPRALERELEMMKEMGCNVVRCSNNKPPQELSALCDRMGILLYEKCFDGMKDPQRPGICGESTLAVSTRGFYRLPLPVRKDDFAVDSLQVDGFDHNAAGDGDIADLEFDRVEKNASCAGEFVPAGFDYLGEPAPYDESMVKSGVISNRQTAVSTYLGVVDLCGMPKDRFYLYRSRWAPEETTVHILPHWNWPGRSRKTVPVYVYSNGDSAELFLNGRSLGRREKILEVTPLNLALGKPSMSSSEEFVKGNRAMMANDGEGATRWCAMGALTGQWWQVDLGAVKGIKSCIIRFVNGADYLLKGSEDGVAWRVLAAGRDMQPMASAEAAHEFDARARYLKLEFVNREEALVSISEFAVYADLSAENEYYRIMDKYRLRWKEVVYEPGELKAVAYKNGKKIGEAVVRTADVPWSLRLSPDRCELSATGEDLSYILVEAVDRKGNVCPLVEDSVKFEVEGPAEIAGTGNGNPQSVESFRAGSHRLFFGKAMLIVRTLEGKKGKVSVRASSDMLKDGKASLHVR